MFRADFAIVEYSLLSNAWDRDAVYHVKVSPLEPRGESWIVFRTFRDFDALQTELFCAPWVTIALEQDLRKRFPLPGFNIIEFLPPFRDALRRERSAALAVWLSAVFSQTRFRACPCLANFVCDSANLPPMGIGSCLCPSSVFVGAEEEFDSSPPSPCSPSGSSSSASASSFKALLLHEVPSLVEAAEWMLASGEGPQVSLTSGSSASLSLADPAARMSAAEAMRLKAAVDASVRIAEAGQAANSKMSAAWSAMAQTETLLAGIEAAEVGELQGGAAEVGAAVAAAAAAGTNERAERKKSRAAQLAAMYEEKNQVHAQKQAVLAGKLRRTSIGSDERSTSSLENEYAGTERACSVPSFGSAVSLPPSSSLPPKAALSSLSPSSSSPSSSSPSSSPSTAAQSAAAASVSPSGSMSSAHEQGQGASPKRPSRDVDENGEEEEEPERALTRKFTVHLRGTTVEGTRANQMKAAEEKWLAQLGGQPSLASSGLTTGAAEEAQQHEEAKEKEEEEEEGDEVVVVVEEHEEAGRGEAKVQEASSSGPTTPTAAHTTTSTVEEAAATTPSLPESEGGAPGESEGGAPEEPTRDLGASEADDGEESLDQRSEGPPAQEEAAEKEEEEAAAQEAAPPAAPPLAPAPPEAGDEQGGQGPDAPAPTPTVAAAVQTSPEGDPEGSGQGKAAAAAASWDCEICGYTNDIKASPGACEICTAVFRGMKKSPPSASPPSSSPPSSSPPSSPRRKGKRAESPSTSPEEKVKRERARKEASAQRKAARAKALHQKETDASKLRAKARSEAILAKLAASNPTLAAKLKDTAPDNLTLAAAKLNESAGAPSPPSSSSPSKAVGQQMAPRI